MSGWSSLSAISGFALVWLSLVIASMCAVIWNIGKLPPGRTMNLIYGVFLIGWLTLAFLISRPNPRFQFHPTHHTLVLSTALLLLSALAITSNNTMAGIADIVQRRASSWDREMDERVRALRSADQNADLLVPQLTAKPETVAWFDITSNPNFWSNRCLAQYFGVKSVRIPAPQR
jgi:predicted small secreted protein